MQAELDNLNKILSNMTPGDWLAWSSHVATDKVCVKPEWFGQIVLRDELYDADQIFTGDEGASCDNPGDAIGMATLKNLSKEMVDVIYKAHMMVKNLDRILNLTGQEITVTVNGVKMKFNATEELKNSLAALEVRMKECELS
jgi:hypothetical protein